MFDEMPEEIPFLPRWALPVSTELLNRRRYDSPWSQAYSAVQAVEHAHQDVLDCVDVALLADTDKMLENVILAAMRARTALANREVALTTIEMVA